MESTIDQSTGILRTVYDIMASSQALNLLAIIGGFTSGFAFAYVALSKTIESVPLRFIVALICGLILAAINLIIVHYLFVLISENYRQILTFILTCMFIAYATEYKIAWVKSP